jgi:hypothetical protein
MDSTCRLNKLNKLNKWGNPPRFPTSFEEIGIPVWEGPINGKQNGQYAQLSDMSA